MNNDLKCFYFVLFVVMLCSIGCSLTKASRYNKGTVYVDADNTRSSLDYPPMGAYVLQLDVPGGINCYEIVYDDKTCFCGQTLNGKKVGMWLLYRNKRKRHITDICLFVNDTLYYHDRPALNDFRGGYIIRLPGW